MYLRETKRRNADGSVVGYLALAYNERDPVSGVPKAHVVHNFGRADSVDRAGLVRLVRSISRFLDPVDAVSATVGSDVQIVDSRPMGASWLADGLFDRLGISATLRRAAAGRRLDAEAVERVIFAMVANRLSVKPLSKLAGCGWVAKRAFVEGIAEMSEDECYRAMDFLHAALPELQETVFFTVANLLNLEVDLLFFDTTSTYWETDRLDDAIAADGATVEGTDQPDTPAPLVESATRAYSKHSKDHRPDLPQVVIGMAVTREGIPVRVWTFPGTTSDQVLIRKVKDDLRHWNLNRVIWVLDRGFNSEENRRYLQRGGGHYIVGEKLRGDSKEAGAVLGRQGRYHTVAANLRVKEVRDDDGVARDRFVICHNPERATRDAAVRAEILVRLTERIASSDKLTAPKRDELYGALATKPAYNRFLRRSATGKLRIDRGAVAADAKVDGKFVMRTSDESLSAEDIAVGYKSLYEAEQGWRDMKSTIDLRPVYHWKPERIEAHIQLCWLALLVLRVAEVEVADTWRNIRNELERMHLVTMATSEGRVSQRTETNPRQRAILHALRLDAPPRFFDFTPAAEPDPS